MRLAGTDLRLLRVFDAVVRHGGLAAAQVELNIGASTISNHITALEDRLGVSLCRRGRGGFKLTEKGRLVFAETQRLLKEVEEFSESVSALRGKLVGVLRIGLVDAISTDINAKLDEAFATYLDQPNDIRFEIELNPPQKLLQRVVDGELDIGIGSFPHKVAGLDYIPLHDEAHSLYCGRRHDFFSKPLTEISADDLKDHDFVGRGYWRDRHHNELGFKNIKAVVFEIEPQLILIRSGAFIGYLPDHMAASWVKRGELRSLSPPAPPLNCPFDLVLKKGRRHSQAVSLFADAVRAAYAS